MKLDSKNNTFTKGIISGDIKPARVKKTHDKKGPLTTYYFPEFNCEVHAHFNDETREVIGRAHIKHGFSDEKLFIDNFILAMLRHHSEDKRTESEN